ncbi:MAG: ribosome-associated translation inhibitor RaiA [Anaerolineaceae bacterium]|nr:ribosome-associated translation inhibitor RaiA [Anaerolineaceae bacterium]
MALEVAIFPKNMELTDRISDYVTKKVSKLDRFISDIDETRVDLGFQKSARNPSDRQVAQITIRGRGFILRTEERSDDIFAAVDMALEKMQRKIERFKGKRSRGRGDGTSISEVTADVNAITSETSDVSPVIARRKTFELVPMDESEALEQMIQLGHENFFVFYNAGTNKINVLYRRRDGSYGLIDPTLG